MERNRFFMATKSQIDANRRNAARSTGPKSAEGKRIVSKNAMRHGLLSSEGLLIDEDPQEFAGFSEQWWQELGPEGPIETALADSIVWLAWKLERARRMEPGLQVWNFYERGAARYIDEYRARFLDPAHRFYAAKPEPAKTKTAGEPTPGEPEPEDLIVDSHFTPELSAAAWSDGAERIEVYEAKIERRLRRQLKELRALQADRNAAADSSRPKPRPGRLDRPATVRPIAVNRNEADCSQTGEPSTDLEEAA
jgi:hypothetical protein